MSDVKIFTFANKKPEYGFTEDGLHYPVHTGKELHPEDYVCELCDNTGDNLSVYNYLYYELTGIYWVRKNVRADIIGNEQYRRRFNIKKEEIEAILAKYDIIMPYPVETLNTTVAKHFISTHGAISFLAVKNLLERFYPSYMEDYNKYIVEGNKLFTSNMCIMRESDYHKMWDFVFSILIRFQNLFWLVSRERANEYVKTFSSHYFPQKEHQYLHSWEEYQTPILAFISERLVTLYVYHNFKNIYYEKIIKYEDIK